MQHQKRRPKGKIKWNKHKKRLQRFPCRDSTVLQMSTRSKKLVPSSPSMSTRSKRGLSLWFQLETSSKCFVSNFMTVWPNVHICMYACVNLTICMCEPTHVWTCCELKVHICMCRPCCGMYVCMYVSKQLWSLILSISCQRARFVYLSSLWIAYCHAHMNVEKYQNNTKKHVITTIMPK